MGDRIPTQHSDSIAPSGAPNDGEYEIETLFVEDAKKEWSNPEVPQFGPITDRPCDTQIDSPVDNIKTLLNRPQLVMQFHAGNSDHWEDETTYDNEGGVLYSLKILEVCEETLAEEGIDLSGDGIAGVSPRQAQTVFLQEARGQNSLAFQTYLCKSKSGQSDVRRALGYDGPGEVLSYSTLRRAYEKLKESDELSWADFEAAVTRAVYTVVRAGIVAPDAVLKKFDFDAVEPPLNESNVPRSIVQNETRQVVRKLAADTLGPLSFDREQQQTSHEIMAFVSACAASAEANKGLSELKDVADWHYPRSNIPGGNWLYNYITDQLSADDSGPHLGPDTTGDSHRIPVIDDQFDAIQRRVLNVADECGFWATDDAVNVAIDMFRVDWSGDSMEVTISRPEKKENDDITEQWTFVIATCVDTERRFALGARLISEKSDYPAAVDDILSNAAECIDFGTILADAEIVGQELIETLREHAGHDWIIRVPNQPIIQGLKRLTPANHAAFAPGVEWGVEPTPNVVTHPTNGKPSKTVRIEPDNVNTLEIKNEYNEKVAVPLIDDNPPQQIDLNESVRLPAPLTSLYDDLESQPGIGNEKQAAYLTDRSMPEQSASGVRFEYIPRWSVEDAIGTITNEFMATIHSSDPKQRLFGVHMAVLMYNWYILINRTLSPHYLRLDPCPGELRKAIQDVGFL
jgi:hypothetical protein